MIHYAAEILRRAWDKTGEDRYLAGIEERAEKMLAVEPKFTDDLAHRILFFRRVLPGRLCRAEGQLGGGAGSWSSGPTQQVERDERALRSSQREDGAWGFAPGQVDRTPTRRRRRWRSMRSWRWAPIDTIRRSPAACRRCWRCSIPMASGIARPRRAS